jgi:hypothetical protein
MALDDAQRAWVAQRLATLDTPPDWHPDGRAAVQRFASARDRRRRLSSTWTWRLVTASIILIALMATPTVRVAAQKAWQTLVARHVAVVEVDVARLPDAVKEALGDQDLGGHISMVSAFDIAEASRRAGFTVRQVPPPLLSVTPQMAVVSPFSMEDRVLSASALERAAKARGITDVTVPPAWDGVHIHVDVGSLVIANYSGQWLNESGPWLLQTTPISIRVPPDFDLPAFVDLSLRLLGLDAAQASTLSQKTVTSSMAFFVVDRTSHRSVAEVPLRSGIGTLIHDVGTDRRETLTLIWNTADRQYALHGAMPEYLAISIANAMQ